MTCATTVTACRFLSAFAGSLRKLDLLLLLLRSPPLLLLPPPPPLLLLPPPPPRLLLPPLPPRLLLPPPPPLLLLRSLDRRCPTDMPRRRLTDGLRPSKQGLRV
jgi:hypothetical protein